MTTLMSKIGNGEATDKQGLHRPFNRRLGLSCSSHHPPCLPNPTLPDVRFRMGFFTTLALSRCLLRALPDSCLSCRIALVLSSGTEDTSSGPHCHSLKLKAWSLKFEPRKTHHFHSWASCSICRLTDVRGLEQRTSTS